jgi:hypothetical protein
MNWLKGGVLTGDTKQPKDGTGRSVVITILLFSCKDIQKFYSASRVSPSEYVDGFCYKFPTSFITI